MAQIRIDREISELLEHLWNLDANACLSGKDYQINLQNKVRGRTDRSSEHLFKYFDENILNRPTYKAFASLLDNYDPDTTKEEVQNEHETGEEKAFLAAILNTEVMRETHSFLKRKGKSPESKAAFSKQLHDIWFKLYRRKTGESINSCGFEHVFNGEIRNGEVIGLHNWIAIYVKEKRDDLNYFGYFDFDKSANGRLEMLTYQIKWKGVLKPRTTSFFGTSPELEMAIYTVAFLCKPQYEDLNLKIYGIPVELKVYGHGNGIGTAFPLCPVD